MSKIGNIALLALIALIPIVGLSGYALNGNDIPAFGDYLVSQENVKHIPGQDSDDWMAVAVSGPNKGGAVDLFTALASYPTHKSLEQSAQGKVKYYELVCRNYATNADKNLYSAPNVVRKCTSTLKTRKQADKHMASLIQTSS